MSISATQDELNAGRGYEALFVPALFAPWPAHLAESVGIGAGDSVLDVACGTGVLARHCLTRTGSSGRVTGLDPAPGMLAAAQEVEPRVDWVLGSAEDLPFENATFDCVVSQFGMMFFQDNEKACREMHRVLKPGGRLAVALWNPIDDNVAYRDIVALLKAEVSTAAGDAVQLPFTMGDQRVTVDLLSSAGFGEISCASRTETATFPSTRTIVEAELRGWLPLFDIHLSEEQIARVLAAAEGKLAGYASATGEAVFPTSAYIATARKPAV